MTKFVLLLPIVLISISSLSSLAIKKSSSPEILSNHKQDYGLPSSTCKLNLNDQHPIQLEGLNGVQPELFFSPDGKTLAATNGSGGSGLVLFDVSIGRHETFMFPGWMEEVSFSPDGKYVAFGNRGPGAYLMNRQNKSIIRLDGHERRMRRIQFSPDSQFIATTSLDNKARVFDLHGNLQTMISGIARTEWGGVADRDPQMTSLSWSSSGKLLTVASGKRFGIWDSQTRKESILEREDLLNVESIRTIDSAKFIPSKDQIIYFSGNMFRVVNSKGIELKKWSIKDHEMRNFSLAPNGQFFATISDDEKNVNLWNIDGNLLTTLKGHREEVTNVLFSQNSQCVITSSFDNTIRLWDISGKELAKIKGSFPIALSPDDRYLATVDKNNDILLWKLK